MSEQEPQIPQHVGIIMDGNRRWGREHEDRTEGKTAKAHMQGALAIEPIVEEAARTPIGHLSLYSFSKQNFDRPDEEKEGLFTVFEEMLESEIPARMIKNKVKVNIIGDISDFPPGIQRGFRSMEERSARNEGIVVNFALGYGGREEIIRAADKAYAHGGTAVDIPQYLDTAGQPDVDLIIRPGGEMRSSDFLTWQAANAEFYSTPVFWPDFTPEHFRKAIANFSERNRRFGK